jgi:hypothetical protein
MPLRNINVLLNIDLRETIVGVLLCLLCHINTYFLFKYLYDFSLLKKKDRKNISFLCMIFSWENSDDYLKCFPGLGLELRRKSRLKLVFPLPTMIQFYFLWSFGSLQDRSFKND